MSTRVKGLIAAAAAALVCSLGSSALASPTPTAHGTQLAKFRVPSGYYVMAAGLGAMWVARADEYNSTLIFRIDPATNVMTRVTELQFPGGGLAVGYGSLWVTDYFGNAVWRLSPAGVVQATISTGLQPESVYLAFGLVWVSDHHSHSVTRIDPSTNAVTATDSAGDPTQFRDGPQAITSDARRIYVGSSNLDVLQSIDPATNTTTTPPNPTNDFFCGSLVPIAGYIWSVDHCSDALYRLRPSGSVVSRVIYGGSGDVVSAVQDATALNDQLWVGVDEAFDQNSGVGAQAALERRDPTTGALLQRVILGGDVTTLRSGFGSLWVFDATHSAIKRYQAPAPSQ